MPTPHNEREPIRILTIDNGGLQAIAVLQTLRTVCQEIAVKNGKWRAPYELFDIIAGVGTGGWLAILLGRFQLDIDQCMTAYVKIAKAIDPNRALDVPKQSENPTAISQSRLIEEIDKLLERKELSKYLWDESDATSQDQSSNRCHAFAVGIAKYRHGIGTNRYDMFRTYAPPAGAKSTDPNPSTCHVSKVCAATAAAKCFVQECKLGETVYWDEDFPNTHCISELALDEANLIFGQTRRPLGIVLNVGPGVPTPKEIKKLQKRANSNATKRFRFKEGCKRAWDVVTVRDPHKEEAVASQELYVETGPQGELHRINSPPSPPTRSSTGSSASLSKRAREKETKLQEAVKNRLFNEYGYDTMYCRLALDTKLLIPEGSKIPSAPYLNDIEHPLWAGQMIDDFLQLPKSQQAIRVLIENWRRGQWPQQHQAVMSSQEVDPVNHATPPISHRSSNNSPRASVASSISFLEPHSPSRSCRSFDQNTSRTASEMYDMRGTVQT